MTDGLYLGAALEGGDRVFLNPDHLTTHAVCLGMTGSGKTGLGIVALEELARRGTPLLVIDLKGDMINLLLNFPEFRTGDFRRWLPPDDAADPTEAARKQAEKWRRGLEGNGLGREDMVAVKQGVKWQLVTPGVASAAPLDILPSLSVPPGWNPDSDPDGARERVNGLTSALLSLVDRGGDPLSDPDHVLLASVILENWRQGKSLDLAGLLASLADPPMNHLGALPLETFYPRDRRMKLVMALNTLVASPAFAAWTVGIPLDMDHLLGRDGYPRATIVTLAHLNDRQRFFCLALLTSELVAWMRRRPASSGLAALLYVDEVQGILPPHPANPPTKGPLMTLLKQGRAFGVGVWLSTQNPVDLDYKALGNAGIKVIGRLITDRDRDRALEGLGMSRTEDGSKIEDLVTGLSKRQFVLNNVRSKIRVRTFSSRWAMSYLRGPVALSEMDSLMASFRPEESDHDEVQRPHEAPGPAPAKKSGLKSAPPVLSTDITQFFGIHAGKMHPWILVRNRITLERRTLGILQSRDEAWRVPVSAAGEIMWLDAEVLSEEPDLMESPPEDASFPPAAPDGLGGELRSAEKSFVRWRARNPVPVLVNLKLKCAAEPGEDRETFVDRCLVLADEADDARQNRTRQKYERKIETLRKRLERETDELTRDQNQLEARKVEEKLGMVEGLFSVLLGSRSLRSAAGKATTKLRSSSSKRRMRLNAEASVVESEHEIERLEDTLDDLGEEMQEEVGQIAAESESIAQNVEETPIRAKQADVVVETLVLVWASE